jgi:hypothetical protein
LFPTTFYGIISHRIFFPLGPNSFYPLFLCSLSIPFFYLTSFLLSFGFPLLFPLFFTNFFSFSFLIPFSLLHFLPFLYYSHTSYPVPLCHGLVQRLLNFSVTKLFIFLISLFPQIFPSSFVPYYDVIRSRGNLPWSSTLLRLYPLLFLLLIVLLFTHLFSVALFYLIPLSYVPALHLTMQFGVSQPCPW